MSASLSDLRNMSDLEVVRQHDEQARNTSVGIDFWLQELDRRSADRAAAASLKLAARSFWLSVISAATSVAALVTAVITLLMTA